MPRSTKKSNTKPIEQPPTITREVKCLGALAGGILLLIAVFVPAEAGGLGRFFNNLLIGLLGFGGIVLPIGLIFISVVNLFSKAIRIPVALSVILFLLILAWIHIVSFSITQENFEAYTLGQMISGIYNSRRLLGGGVVGALLGILMRFLFGHVGALLILSTAAIICLVLMTKKSFVSLLESGANKVKGIYEERRSRYEQEEDYESEEELPPLSTVAMRTKKRPPVNLGAKREPNLLTEVVELDTDDRDNSEYRVRLADEDFNQKPYVPPERIAPFVEKQKNWVMPEESYPNYEQEYDREDDYQEIEGDFEYEEKPSVSNLVVRGLVADAEPSPSYEHIEDEFAATEVATPPIPHNFDDFELPPISILARNEKQQLSSESRTQVMKNSRILEETLKSFRVDAEVVEVSVGPTVTRYDLAPAPGVKVNSIVNLSNDLALSLAAQGIRIEAPIPGKAAVGIEIPNKEPQGVFLREIIEGERFENFNSKLAFSVGKDIAGNPVVADVADMPHLLIAGATGAGKSVCINTLIASILYKARPDEVKLLMVDPKVVELSVYNGIPHLLIPVVTDPKKASGALNWAVQEMESRYNLFAGTGCRDLKSYNKVLSTEGQPELPQIVIIIDELADLMMTAKGEVEEAICRLAQKARAAGIHLIVATQRPSVDVITGLIKANIPSRLAFAVSSGTDSRTVLDMQGAEKLLGRGDMLFLPRGLNKPIRIQGCFISDKEVETLVAFLKAQAPVEHTTEMIQQITMPGKANVEGDVDEFFHDAVDFLLIKGKASTSMLQRQFRIGYNRASRLMDDLEIRGIVGPEDGVKPRKVTITREEYSELYGR